MVLNSNGMPAVVMIIPLASGSHLDLSRAPYDLYGVKYIDLVSLAPFSGHVPRVREDSGQDEGRDPAAERRVRPLAVL